MKTAKLRKMFKGDEVIRIVGAHDGMTAKLVENAGFEGVWASGLEISTSFAVPDANILTMSQYLERASEVNDAVSIPVIADCDTGYGNSNNVIYAVKKYEAAGIAAICIEDKLFPKVNSYIPGRQELAPVSEFVGKIMAAKHAQTSREFMVIARVEALIAGWGMDEALKRANAYVDAGADAVLIHSKADTPREIIAFSKQWGKRAPLVVVPTTYPNLNIKDMKKLGIKMVIYANPGIRASVKAISEVFEGIKKTGKLSSATDKIVPMNSIFELQGMYQMKDAEKKYLKQGAESVKVVIPAAGDPSYEKSMRTIVKDSPVAMLDINGKSILERNVEMLRCLNITDIKVVTGYNADKFTAEGVEYVRNKNYKTTSQLDSIMLTEKELNGPVLILFSDIIVEEGIIRKVVDTSSDMLLVIDSSMPRKEGWIDYVVTERKPVASSRKMHVLPENKIVRIGKSVSAKDAGFEFTGIAYFSKKGIGILKKAYKKTLKSRKKSRDPRGHYVEVLQNIIDEGHKVSGFEVSSGWMEVRSFENYKAAHQYFG